MIALLADLLLAALVMLALYGAGRGLQRLVRLDLWTRSAEIAFSFAFGLGAAVTLLFLLGLVGWLRPAAGWVLLALGVGLALVQTRTLLADARAAWAALREALAAPWFVKMALLVALAFVAANLVTDLAPPLEGDTVHQYLLVPRYWVEAGRYFQPTHIWAGTLPGNMMMLSAWALLLNGSFSLAALVTGFDMSLLLALGVYALARLHTGRTESLLAAAIIITMPDAAYLAQSAKVDMGWAFFEALALAAFFRWLQVTGEGEGRDAANELRGTQPGENTSAAIEHRGYQPRVWLVLCGVMLGLAAGSKNQTFISIGLLGLWLVLREAQRGGWRVLARSGAAFGLAALVAMLPYYLYNAVEHLNPLYPVFAGPLHRLLGATPSPRSELGTEVFYPWTVGGYFANLWNASLGHTDPGFYLGMIAGPVFLMAIPAGALLGALRRRRPAQQMLVYALVFSVIWFLVKQAVRHFLPGLILLSGVAAIALHHIGGRSGWRRQAILGVVSIAFLVNLANALAVMVWNGAYRVVLGIETREAYIERWHEELAYPTFPDGAAVRYLNEQVGAGARVLAEHPGSPLYIAPDIVSPLWGDRERLDTIDNVDTLLERLAASDITYIMVSKADPDDQYLFTQPDFLGEYAELVFEGPRTQVYRVTALMGD